MSRPSSSARRWWRRGLVWERTGTGLLALGLVMLMQPWSLTLFSHGFAVVLAGVVVFSIALKMPQE